MTTAKELRAWLRGMDPGTQIAIDEGGLTLIAFDGAGPTYQRSEDYFEIGGEPANATEQGDE